MRRLFISDLHLDEQRPDISRALFAFLRDIAPGAGALYILGDFFESWVGDDDDSALIREVKAALRALSDSGTALFFMHGNRDFLIGEDFCTATGATLLDDPCVIELDGEPLLLMHGDSLCTGDTEYLKFRQTLRSPAWQAEVLAKPLAERHALARQLRMASGEANSNKAEDIMDVSPDAVIQALRQHNCRRLLHGHTHRPARHPLQVDGQSAERIVLGDWDHLARYLQAENGQLELLPWPIAESI